MHGETVKFNTTNSSGYPDNKQVSVHTAVNE